MRDLLPIILLVAMLVLTCFIQTLIDVTGFLATFGIVFGASLLCGILLWIADNL